MMHQPAMIDRAAEVTHSGAGAVPRHLLLAGALVVVLAAVCSGDAPPRDPDALVKQAREIVSQGEYQRAEAMLQEALSADPAHMPAILALADLYELLDRKEDAMDLYGQVLATIDISHEKARDRLRRLFYQGRFPRRLRLGHLAYGPVDFTIDSCRLSGGLASAPSFVLRFAYSTSLIFPQQLSRRGSAPWVRLPSSGARAPSLMYNRVSYGLIAQPDAATATTRWMVGYPSATILSSAADYSSLAARLVQVMLRAHIYLQRYLGLDREPAGDGLLQIFLTEEGPTGAEQSGDSIFFYDVDHDRSPLEWTREVFHEIGHLLLPRTGPFEGEDRWGNGALGERLLFQWLLEEAGAVTGSPWPSYAASEALDAMWGATDNPTARYLVDSCRVPLNAWLATEPEEFQSADAVERFAGFCLWVQAAHGRSTLADVLKAAAGPAPAQFVDAYKQLVTSALRTRSLSVDAGALNPMTSELQQPYREGAVRRELIVLGQGGHATYRVYLPAGNWALTIGHDVGGQASLEVTLDGTPAPTLDDQSTVSLGEIADGWHTLTVVCASQGPVILARLTFHADV